MNTLQYPNEALRKKLVIGGIPESEHSMDALAAKMPDFEVRALEGISVDMLAELLLYFIAKGIVALPIASDQALLDMPWGSHVCQFYDCKDDLVKMLVPYFKQGLERNEACMWLVGDLTVEEARNAMAAVVPDLERFMATGQMQIRHYTEFYTNANGTVKPSDQLSDGFAAAGSTARANGFAGLRASGSVSWVNDAESMSQFMDYETKVNLAIQNSRIMAVCTYPARAAAMCRCRELIHNHGKIFVKRGEWVHDKSKDAEKIEAVFASLAAQSHAANVGV
jgi:MEDS: MEthanogen/methylotroph, DcmR Sensory domain